MLFNSPVTFNGPVYNSHFVAAFYNQDLFHTFSEPAVRQALRVLVIHHNKKNTRALLVSVQLTGPRKMQRERPTRAGVLWTHFAAFPHVPWLEHQRHFA